MSSSSGLLRQQPLRPTEAGHCLRRLAPAGLLKLVDPRPGGRTLPLARGDEGLQFDAAELRQVGAARLPGKRGTLHAVYFAQGDVSGQCRNDVRRAIAAA